MTDGVLSTVDGDGGIEAIAGEIGQLGRQLHKLRVAQRESRRPEGFGAFPRRDVVVWATTQLTRALFPQRIGGFAGAADEESNYVEGQLRLGLSLLRDELQAETDYWEIDAGERFEADHVEQILRLFCQSLERVRRLVDSDIEAAFSADPAAQTIEEILVSYPSAHAILWHRIAHELFRLGAPIIARIIAEAAHERTGIDIHPGAQIGPSFFVDHGTGVVIGETARIGARVRLYQQVTLGARAPAQAAQRGVPRKGARHPVVGDDVVIYAGATILGPVSVGAGAIIGGNSWVLDDVPEGAVVAPAETVVLTGAGAARARDRLLGETAARW